MFKNIWNMQKYVKNIISFALQHTPAGLWSSPLHGAPFRPPSCQTQWLILWQSHSVAPDSRGHSSPKHFLLQTLLLLPGCLFFPQPPSLLELYLWEHPRAESWVLSSALWTLPRGGLSPIALNNIHNDSQTILPPELFIPQKYPGQCPAHSRYSNIC